MPRDFKIAPMIATRGFVSDLKLLLCDVHYTIPIHPLSAMSGRSNSDVRKAEVDTIQYSSCCTKLTRKHWGEDLVVDIRPLEEYRSGSVRSEQFLIPVIFPSREAVVESAVHGGSK